MPVVMPEMTVSEVKLQSDLMSTEQAQPLLLKLTDEQLATLKPYGHPASRRRTAQEGAKT
jgi:hypothetical protein